MEKTIIFHLSANKKLANEVAKILNAPVGEVEIEHFLDGEIMARNMTNVRGKNAIIIQSTGKPAQDNIVCRCLEKFRSCFYYSSNSLFRLFSTR